MLYDGTPILADVDSEGNSNFHTPFLLSAALVAGPLAAFALAGGGGC